MHVGGFGHAGFLGDELALDIAGDVEVGARPGEDGGFGAGREGVGLGGGELGAEDFGGAAGEFEGEAGGGGVGGGMLGEDGGRNGGFEG